MITVTRGGPPHDRGSSGIFILLGTSLAVSGAAVAGLLVAASGAHARADAVADLAALAGAGALLEPQGACAAAAASASDNGSRLLECGTHGDTVIVRVSVPLPAAVAGVSGHAEATAEAAARLIPDPALSWDGGAQR
jgi:hypothetical protein